MSLRHALLGMLAERPASGYDLLKTFASAMANVWPATQSQIYTDLTKLADNGLISVSAEGPRGRKEYTITEAGMAELRHWLTEVEPHRPIRSEVLLRVFFLGVLTPQEAHAYLEGIAEHAAESQSDLRELEKSIDWDDSDLSVYGRIAMEWGLRFTEFQQDWASWAQDRIRNRTAQE